MIRSRLGSDSAVTVVRILTGSPSRLAQARFSARRCAYARALAAGRWRSWISDGPSQLSVSALR